MDKEEISFYYECAEFPYELRMLFEDIQDTHNKIEGKKASWLIKKLIAKFPECNSREQMKLEPEDLNSAFEAEGIDKEGKLTLDEMTKIAYNVFQKIIDRV